MRVYFDYVLPFWVSIGLLSLCQGVVVCLPRAWSPVRMARLSSRLWALIPAISVIAFVAVGRVAERDSARTLTYLALVAVPLLAALALGWLARGARPGLALLVTPLFALAWADRGGLAGEGAAVALSALSCVALGALIAGVTPARWLALGIVAMAAADAALVVSDLLQGPNDVLNAARPAGGLPRLQAAVFGSATMGYGDLFVAGVLGGLLACAREGAVADDRSRQLTGAVLVVLLAFAFDFLFFVVDELPATVPVAGALAILVLRARRRGVGWVGARAASAPAATPGPSPASAAPARAPAPR
ncbi:MAG TPA: hypothetical protein VFV03_08000 [Solirubrobacteraceae bacterium]|nr:hypothetical protein [Solirubrobacteraceae bacterium]